MTPEEFVLDQVTNPHPRMLAGAIRARQAARDFATPAATYRWQGYLQAMVDATGEPAGAIEAWMDRAVAELTR